MNKNKTQALLPRECELDRLYLDISVHSEAASVGTVTNVLACLSHFFSADMISNYNWLILSTHYNSIIGSSLLRGDLTPLGEYLLTTVPM